MSDKDHDTNTDFFSTSGENTQAGEENNEQWDDKDIPVDDYDDAAALPEEEDGENPTDSAEPATNEEGKSKGRKILLLVGLVGVVFVGGLLYLQFGSSPAPTPIAVPIAQVMDVSKVAPPPRQEEQPKAVTGSQSTLGAADHDDRTEPVDMATLYSVGRPAENDQAYAIPQKGEAVNNAEGVPPSEAMKTDTTTSLPDVAANVAAPVAAEDHSFPKELLQPQPSPQGDSVASSANVSGKTGSAMDQKADSKLPVGIPAAGQPDETATALPNMQQPNVGANVPAQKAAIVQKQANQTDNGATSTTALDAKLAALQATVNKLEKQVQTPAPVMPLNLAANGNIDERLSTIEQKIAALSEKMEKSRRETKGVVLPQKAVQSTEDASGHVSSPVVSKKHADLDGVRKSHKKHSVKSQAPKAQTKPVQWVLKAATPEAAWIMDPSKGGLKKVSVGEDVAGIGKVQAINQFGNSWVVLGSKGSIR